MTLAASGPSVNQRSMYSTPGDKCLAFKLTPAQINQYDFRLD